MVLAQVICALTTQGGFQAHDNPYAAYLPNPLSDIFANLLLVQSWGLTNSVVGTAWSISTEWAAYLVFPFLVVPVLRARRRTAIILGCAAVLLLAAAAALDLHDGAYHSGSLDAYSGTQIAPLLRCFGDFTLGMLMCRLSQMRGVTTWIARDTVGFALMAGVALTFTMGLPDLAVVVLFPPLVAHLSANRGFPAWLLANSATVRLGELSYAIYLLHPLLERPGQNLADTLYGVLPPIVAFVLAGIVISTVLLALAAGAFRWIEQPGRRLLRQAETTWYERRQRAAAR
jgi:peptidoglycan/LPS O-acetylase OafA/YrhL